MINNKWDIMDLHNHSIFSDGSNTIKELIENAAINKIDILGITDHFEIIQQLTGLDNYFEEIEKLKKDTSIKILTGIEASAFTVINEFNSKLIDKLNENLDYILIEEINYFRQKDLFDALEEKLIKFTCKKGMAHTDIVEMVKYNLTNLGGMDFLIKYMKENSLFWELNVNPARKYFNMLVHNGDDTVNFIKMLNKNGIPVSIGSDCHSLIYKPEENIIYANNVLKDYITLRPF